VTQYDIFNGDSDGLCALTQLRLEEDIDSKLITGAKRDIRLLDEINFQEGDSILALDISLARNRDLVIKALDRGVRIRWIDHHLPGEPIDNPLFESIIDTASDVCTSVLVNHILDGRQSVWAAVGAFGDSIPMIGYELVKEIHSDEEIEELKTLGRLLNYNAYGRTLKDLHFHPIDLYKSMLESKDPFCFMKTSMYYQLLNGYNDDMEKARKTMDGGILISLPNEPWAFRISGSLAHLVAKEDPDLPHIITSDLGNGTIRVSIRAPASNPQGAGELCAHFGGGGRAAAGGIDILAIKTLDELVDSVRKRWPMESTDSGTEL